MDSKCVFGNFGDTPDLLDLLRCLSAKERSTTMDQHKVSRKRPFSEVVQSGSSSRETKRIRLCTDEDTASWKSVPTKTIDSPQTSEKMVEAACHEPTASLCKRGVKRPFSEIAEDIDYALEMPSKRRRMASGEVKENMEAPHTSAVHPSPVVKVPQTQPIIKTEAREEVHPNTIWIIGSSYIRRGERAAYHLYGKNFGLSARVEFFGRGGLGWRGVLPRFYGALSTKTPPDILVVHAGGNDLGLVPATQLAAQMTDDLKNLNTKFPSLKIVFSCINQRQVWRRGHPKDINNDRQRVNEMVSRAVYQFGGEVVEHPLLRFFVKKLYLPDGVHLSWEGNKLFLSAIHEVLKKILS